MKRIFKIRSFNRWQQKAKLSDQALLDAVLEIEAGLIDADLGQGLIKKRIALPGRGKRGGARTLLATNKVNRWFFLYGFQKNEKENITDEELEALQLLASDHLALTDRQLDHAKKVEVLMEICYDNET